MPPDPNERCATPAGGRPPPLPSMPSMPLRRYGELVIVGPQAAPEQRPGAEGWIVGIDAGAPAVLYSIEFEDGKVVHLHAHELLPGGA